MEKTHQETKTCCSSWKMDVITKAGSNYYKIIFQGI